MLEIMDRMRRKIFFSGNNTEKNNETQRLQEEIVYEGQIVNERIVKEEQEEEVKVKENRKSRFIANYNMFF